MTRPFSLVHRDTSSTTAIRPSSNASNSTELQFFEKGYSWCIFSVKERKD